MNWQLIAHFEWRLDCLLRKERKKRKRESEQKREAGNQIDRQAGRQASRQKQGCFGVQNMMEEFACMT